MGTTWSVTIAGAADESLGPVRLAIEAVLAGIIAQMSPWEPASDISLFNASPAGTWRRLPPDFTTVLACALDVAEASNGAYDPTIGPLVNLWGFGPTGRRVDIPADEDIGEALMQVGWRRLVKDSDAVLQPGGVYLDLSSIAKGYAVDQVSACLDCFGLSHHLVEIGGELRGHGMKPDGAPWWVAVERSNPDDIETVIALHGLSIATSGGSRRFIEWNGERLPHVIDPHTGRPMRNGTEQVTVLHRNCMVADTWATALMVLEAQEALALATQHDLAARIVARAAGGVRERLTPAFAAMLD